MRSEQEKEEEKGMPIIVVTDDKTKLVMAQVVPSTGAQCAGVCGERGQEVREQLGYKIVMKSGSEPVILALKKAVRRERRAWRLSWRSPT